MGPNTGGKAGDADTPSCGRMPFDDGMCRALESFPEALAQPLGAAPAPQHGSSVSKKFRVLGVGQTAYGEGSRLMLTRAKLDKLAPGAHAVPGSLDIFGSYATLP